jgi:hypothetical protein
MHGLLLQEVFMAAVFYGPIFIVGMPRSGTKLIRALLNQHPQINLTLAESHFIPYYVRKFGNPPPFRGRDDLHPFVRELRQTSFFSTMSKAGYSLDEATFLKNVDYTTWDAIFEHVFRHFGSKRAAVGTIWGDKTPGYINHMPLLKGLFPRAKFIHMVRDPRDYCLSVRKSFGKSIYRAAVRWRTGVENARQYGIWLAQDYMEVRYELLLEKPVSVMTQVASFLGLPYDAAMVNLTSAPEEVGDAKGQIQIVKDNKRKYITQLAPEEIKGIEEIVCDVARAVGYRLENNVAQTTLNPLTLGILKLYDGVASLKYHVATEGDFAQGTKRLFHHYKRSSWRGIESS